MHFQSGIFITGVKYNVCGVMVYFYDKHIVSSFASHFYTPDFRRDVLWYGDVRLGLCPSVHPSVRPTVTVFRIFLLHALSTELKFCISLYYDARKSMFECHQFPSIFAGVMPLFNFKLLQYE